MTFHGTLLCWNHRRSKSSVLVFTEGISLCPKTPMFGWSPIQIDIRGDFCPYCFSIQVGIDWGRIHYPNKSKEEWANHQYSDPHHWWGRRGWPGHGDGLLSPWSGQDRGLWWSLHLMPVQLIRAECGGGEKTLPISLEGCPVHFIWNGPFLWGCCFCPIPFRQTVFVPATSFQQIRGTATKWGGGKRV